MAVKLVPKEQIRFLMPYMGRGLTYNLEGFGPIKWTGFSDVIP